MEIKKVEIISANSNRKISIASGPVIFDEKRVLLVRGKNGTHFKFPGGYIKDDENFKETALREAKEEINCDIEVEGNPLFYFLNIFEESHDIILIHYRANIISGEPQATGETEEVKWFDINNLPKNIYENVKPVISKLISVKI